MALPGYRSPRDTSADTTRRGRLWGKFTPSVSFKPSVSYKASRVFGVGSGSMRKRVEKIRAQKPRPETFDHGPSPKRMAQAGMVQREVGPLRGTHTDQPKYWEIDLKAPIKQRESGPLRGTWKTKRDYLAEGFREHEAKGGRVALPPGSKHQWWRK
jgi:hypothetical protein